MRKSFAGGRFFTSRRLPVRLVLLGGELGDDGVLAREELLPVGEDLRLLVVEVLQQLTDALIPSVLTPSGGAELRLSRTQPQCAGALPRARAQKRRRHRVLRADACGKDRGLLQR